MHGLNARWRGVHAAMQHLDTLRHDSETAEASRTAAEAI